ncbi:hypothetical protein MXAN_3493 [Myxococcus xanthus DK 1622]|uniref:Uncharacterized protein n=1 Tax=Myxococcus xanthus (strain DK1622) TaxID=246197 RepID=Q1D6N5_MYXXD|nr:hypothetical protein MXAN_3493 [Myxococcus xanthus DK 1622]
MRLGVEGALPVEAVPEVSVRSWFAKRAPAKRGAIRSPSEES